MTASAIPDSFPVDGTSLNPHLRHARDHNVAWFRRFGALRRNSCITHYLGMHAAEACAAIYPDITAEDLDLAVDIAGWMLMHDDLQACSASAHDPHLADAICRPLLGVFTGQPGQDDGPIPALTHLLADLWDRERAGMSPAWRRRAAGNWTDLITANTQEVRIRRDGVPLTLHDYLVLRRKSGNTATIADLDERVHHHGELPEIVWEQDFFQQIHRAFLDAAIYTNDFFGWGWEESSGDFNNSVFILERELGLSREDAAARVGDLLDANLARFRELGYRDLPPRLTRQWLSEEEIQAALRFVDAMHNVIGCLYRYTSTVEVSRYGGGTTNREAWLPHYLSDLVPDQIHTPNVQAR